MDEDLSDLIDALKQKGFNIPDEVEDMAGLLIAIKANPARRGGSSDYGDDDTGDDFGGTSGGDLDTPRESDGQPMLMSDVRAEPVRPGESRGAGVRRQAALAAQYSTGY